MAPRLHRMCRFLFPVVLLLAPFTVEGKTAEDVIDRVWRHLGGRANYEAARYLRFTWVVELEGVVVAARHHTWDRKTGDYVVAIRERASGDSITVFFNVNTKQGVALRNGEKEDRGASQELIDDAYGAFINDTYWLLAPAKLEDPGVRATIAETLAGDTTVLHLAFDGVGLTPGDQYWLYVTGSGKIAGWRYTLESGRKGDFLWTDERDCGMGLRFATKKSDPERGLHIIFPEVRFSGELDRRVFRPPDNE